MEKQITPDNLRCFAYVNDAICQKEIKGIVLSFLGLNDAFLFRQDPVEGEFYAEKGILYVIPYSNPWSWMNRQTVAYTDEILDVLFEKYGLPESIPIVSTGKSMGGQSALVYMVYARRTPVSCVVNCPVCDMVYHYTEREDLPRTLYSALQGEPGRMEEALQRISPLHLAEKLPHAAYHIFHCREDEAVKISAHSDRLVAELRHLGLPCTYDIVEGRGHCQLTLEAQRKFAQYVLEATERSARKGRTASEKNKSGLAPQEGF